MTRRGSVDKSSRSTLASRGDNDNYKCQSQLGNRSAIRHHDASHRGHDTAAGPLRAREVTSPIRKEVAVLSKKLTGITCAVVLVAVSGLTASVASAAATLQGAGSTLVAPIEAEWAAAWANQTGNPAPTYQAVGSGTGLKDIGSGLVDFGASDAPISASTTPCPGCFQIPWAAVGDRPDLQHPRRPPTAPDGLSHRGDLPRADNASGMTAGSPPSTRVRISRISRSPRSTGPTGQVTPTRSPTTSPP